MRSRRLFETFLAFLCLTLFLFLCLAVGRDAESAQRTIAVVPTGTGFFHVTGGVGDVDAAAVSLSGSEVTGSLPQSQIAGAVVDPSTNGLRLTVTSGSPIPADVGSVSTLYLEPFVSDQIALYDTTAPGRWYLRTVDPLTSIAIGTGANLGHHDVFAYWTGTFVALELSAAWASSTTRADTLTPIDGVLLKSGALTRRLVGSFRRNSTSTRPTT